MKKDQTDKQSIDKTENIMRDREFLSGTPIWESLSPNAKQLMWYEDEEAYKEVMEGSRKLYEDMKAKGIW